MSRLNEHGGAEPIRKEEIANIRQSVREADPASPTARWAQWILSDQETRQAAPGSHMNRKALLNRLLRSSDHAELIRTLQLAPTSALVHVRIAHALVTSDEIEDLASHQQTLWLESANRYVSRAIDLGVDNAEVRAYQADILMRTGKTEEAREAARRAVELDTKSLNAQYVDAVTSATANEWSDAQDAFCSCIGTPRRQNTTRRLCVEFHRIAVTRQS